MRGVRFYLEHASSYRKRRREHAGNVVAVTGHACLPGMLGAVAAGGHRPNSWVASCIVQDDWLRLYCRRIPEQMAREIHPELFRYLDD